MSSQLTTFARIAQLNNIKQCLAQDDSEEAWLQHCFISFSPVGDILVIAQYNRMVILSSKWCPKDCDEVKTIFHVTWQGVPESCGGEDIITSVTCLPIAAAQTRISAHYNPEWTCIVVGFSTGHVRFYTELGCLLISQLFHNEPVTNIKCRSSQLSWYSGGYMESNEEVYIIYSTVICSIIGFALFNTLRACRSQLARVQAKYNESISVPPLTYRKWGFSEQEKIEDCVVAGAVPTNTFLHLVTASLRGGFDAEYRNNPPQRTLVVASGNTPFIGFHYAIESSPLPVLSDVAKALATKLKSAIGQAVPSWLFGNRGPPAVVENDTDQSGLEPTEIMACRFGLYDTDRIGNTIIVSPLANFGALTDSLGRVSIIDLLSGIIIRMLKGYREAQCGWLLVHESSSAKNCNRRTLFLVIYVAKKGVLEIWPVHNGPRVAIFNVQKNGRLLYSNYNTVGGINIGSKQMDGSYSGCVLLESSGELREVIIPFHCVLSSKDSNKARDAHLLKHMIKLLHDGGVTNEKLVMEITSLGANLKTNDIKKHAITALSSNKHVTTDAFLPFLQAVRKNLTGSNDDEKEILNHIYTLENLAAFHQFLNETYDLPPNYSADLEDIPEVLSKEVCSVLCITEEDIDKLLTLIPTMKNKSKQVTFSKHVDNKLTLVDFIAAFNIADKSVPSLKPDIPETSIAVISDLVCSSVMYRKCDLDVWKIKCKMSDINPSDILKMVFSYWLCKELGITIQTEMLNLYEILISVCDILGNKSIKWRKVRAQLANSPLPLSAITAAIVCRAVSSHIHLVKSKLETESYDNDSEDINATSEWETVTQDECDWNILISQLEDISFLDSALKYQPKELPSVLYCAPYEIPDVTLSSILKSGKGAISELVARWITSLGLNPEYFLHYEASVKVQTQKKSILGVREGIALSLDKAYEAKPINLAEKEILDQLDKLRTFFPYSLSADCLLTNICWEYVLVWKKSLEELKALQSALITLKLISSPYIRQGCCCLIWTAHLSQVCENAARLINKVGKIPKDRLCKQNIGITQDKITEFIELWTEFITIFVEAVAELEIASEPVLQYEVLWDNNDFISNTTSPPLCQLAVKQKKPNPYLLRLQSQCTRALLILTTFSLRMQKPLNNLFDSTNDAVLFFHIQSEKVFNKNIPDDMLIECRITFLKKAISGVIGDILKPNIDPNLQISDYADLIKPAVDWFNRILTLGLDWSVPVDILRRHQIRKLYTYGYDPLAEEIRLVGPTTQYLLQVAAGIGILVTKILMSRMDKVIPSVSDKDVLGQELLIILGQRLKKMLNMSADYFSHFSPSVTSWAESLDDGVHRITLNIKDMLQLALTINHLIPEDGTNRHIVNQMLDSLEMLKDNTEIVSS